MAVETAGVVLIFCALATGEFLVVSHNGPAVLGATITVRANLYDDLNQRVANNYGQCNYGFTFTDNAEPPHRFLDFSKTCSSLWRVTYEVGLDAADTYNISVIAYVKRGIRYWPIARVSTMIDVTTFLNGGIDLYQNGQPLLHNDPVFLYSGVSAQVKLTAADKELLTRLGATFKTDWSFEVEPPCNGGCKAEGMTKVWSLAQNAYPGTSYDLKFSSFHGSYVDVRARVCAVVQNNTDLASLGNFYGFFYRRFLLLDPSVSTSISNFTVESDQKSGHLVVKNDQVDAVIIEN